MLGFMKGSLQGCCVKINKYFGSTNATEKYINLSNTENNHDTENPIFIHSYLYEL